MPSNNQEPDEQPSVIQDYDGQEEQKEKEHVTVLVGRDGMLKDLIEIGEFNGVKMGRVADLPYDRVRGRPRARNIKRTDSYRKTGQGVPRVPIGRRS